jgi:hypothetical protein
MHLEGDEEGLIGGLTAALRGVFIEITALFSPTGSEQ